MDVEGSAWGLSSLSVLNLHSQVFGRQPVTGQPVCVVHHFNSTANFLWKQQKKKQFISTIIKNSMQTVEVKSTSSHNCLSQNDDATLNSWSQVCRWSYIWLISGTGTLYKNMLVSIGYQNFYFDFVIQTIDRRRIYDWMWENHQTLRANGSTTFFLRFMKHFIRLNLYQIIKS